MLWINNSSYIEYFFFFFNILNSLSLFIFFFHIFVASFFFIGNFQCKKYGEWYKYYFNIMLLCFFLLYFIKFYLIFYNKYIFFVNFFFFWSLSIIGDSILMLVFIILFISMLYISEQGLYKKDYSIFFYFIFIVLTIQITSTNNLLLMVIFFEFLFLPSLYFLHNSGYSIKIGKSIQFLLIWLLSGTFFALIGIIYLYTVFNVMNFSFIMVSNNFFLEKKIVSILFFFGFGVKIPIWPFHYWLTKVHVEASTGFSIFLSGFLVKVPLFCIVNTFNLFIDKFTFHIYLGFVLFGLLDSSLRIWSATDIKRLVAYTTIQEMNLILLLFLISGNNSYFFLNSFIIVHALLSALLFYLVDNIQKKVFSRNLSILGGFSIFFPKLSLLIWLSLIIFRSFPIFVKFLIEWEIITLFFINFGVVGIVFLFFILIFSVLGLSRIFFIILYGQPLKKFICSSDFFKRDWIIGLSIVGLFFCVNSVLILCI